MPLAVRPGRRSRSTISVTPQCRCTEGAWRRRTRERCLRVHRQRDGCPRCLSEIEIAEQIAEDGNVLAHIGTWIGPTITAWIDALTAEEIVFDELVIGVETEGLMIDVPLARIGADHNAGHAK